MPILGIMASQISGHLIPPSSFYSIATVTGNGSGSVLTFSSIPQTYKSLQIRGFIGNNGSGQTLQLKYNSDTTAANYANHYLAGFNGSASAGNSLSSGATLIGYAGGISPSPYPDVVIIDIVDYASTTKYKTIRSIFGTNTNGAYADGIELDSGLWQNTAAISSLTLSGLGSMATSTSFALYGVK